MTNDPHERDSTDLRPAPPPCSIVGLHDQCVEPPDSDPYASAMDLLIDQAIDYMGRDRAVEIANSAPIEVDENGTIQEFQFGETEESKRAITEMLLEAYVQVVGRQLVIDMLEASTSGQQLLTLEQLCSSDGAQLAGPG